MSALPPKADITKVMSSSMRSVANAPQSTTSDGRTCGAKQRLAIQASADSGTAPTRKANVSERSHYNTTHVSYLPHPRMCNPSDEPTGGYENISGALRPKSVALLCFAKRPDFLRAGIGPNVQSVYGEA
jgi:hypothetical protein